MIVKRKMTLPSAERFANLADAFIQSVLIFNVGPGLLTYSPTALGLSTVNIPLSVCFCLHEKVKLSITQSIGLKTLMYSGTKQVHNWLYTRVIKSMTQSKRNKANLSVNESMNHSISYSFKCTDWFRNAILCDAQRHAKIISAVACLDK